MSTVAPPPTASRGRSIADLLAELGDVPAHRVRRHPPPGTATETDCLRLNESGVRCELVNGTLVEKAVGSPQSVFALLLGHHLVMHTLYSRLGAVTTTDGLFRMLDGNIREPDVGFTRRDRVPVPMPQVIGWCPDLCVEIVSPGNTAGEMAVKRGEYFASGCRLMWVIHAGPQTVEVYAAADDPGRRLTEADTLDGGAVLPGFQLPLSVLFREYRIAMGLEP